MRTGASLLARLGLVLVAGLAPAAAPYAAPIDISSVPIDFYRGEPVGTRIDGLVWRGGLELNARSADFGGLSDITFTEPAERMLAVSDRGKFLSLLISYDERGAPAAVSGAEMTDIVNSKGAPLPNRFSADAEGLETILRDGMPAAVRVSFENLTRVADFALDMGQPVGPAREVAIPDRLSAARTNESLESVCIAPPASPVAGSTVLLTEAQQADGGYAGFMLGNADRGPLVYVPGSGLNPTSCAFAPNGDLYVLERGVAILSFTMRVVRIPADQVQPGARLRGQMVLSGSGGDIDNMEGMAIHTGPDGGTRLSLMSDNNFNDWERTLLLQFDIPE